MADNLTMFKLLVRRVQRETEKGVLLVFEPDGEEDWFPKSQITGDYEVGDEDITLLVPAWLADAKQIPPF